MRRIEPHQLWVGNARDARDWAALARAGIEVIVDLAVNEPVNSPPREMVYCRFALTDGMGNPSWRIAAAVRCVAHLIAEGTPVLVHCSAGMSRAPSIAAAGLALATGEEAGACLARIEEYGGVDVSPRMWAAVVAALRD